MTNVIFNEMREKGRRRRKKWPQEKAHFKRKSSLRGFQRPC